MRQKSFERKSWYPPPIHKLFRSKKLSEKWRVPLRIFSILWENHYSTKLWYTILWNFFKPDIFWMTSVPLLIFSVLWDKKVSRESRDFPLLAIKMFDKRKVLKNERFSFEKFRYCEKINFRQNRDTTSYAIYLFQKFSEKKGPTRSFFGTVRQKFREKVVISPCYP